MNVDHPICTVLRLVLETTAPLSIASGRADPRFDVMLARDANGLPFLPGTALAGVLRGLAAATGEDDTRVEDLFGREARRAAARPTEPAGLEASRLQVSHGLIHDWRDRPVEETLASFDPNDAILALAAQVQPDRRDNVRLSHRGVVDGRGKFERAILPPGYRFTTELTLWSPDPDGAAVDIALLRRLIVHPAFRLGGATRRGCGAMKPVQAWTATWDLREPEGLLDHARHDRRLAAIPPKDGPLAAIELAASAAGDCLTVNLALTPEDFWRVGQGDEPLVARAGRTPDLLQVTGRRVVWKGHDAVLTRDIVLPATTIKGALAHRVAFHFNRLNGRFVDQKGGVADDNPAVEALFGHVHQREGSAVDAPENEARAGRVLFDDARLSCDKIGPMVGHMTHNSIDRFTGGVREGALYEEELIFDQPVQLIMTVMRPQDPALEGTIRQALVRALDDLLGGRLGLGAGVNKGHGFFSGERGALAPLREWAAAS
ncbi:MAG: hypothetical protein HQL40_04855 [Alphaproteobacteria bacterium]|nr:hypothetical protein [Alphaproteobacteria bacterium]